MFHNVGFCLLWTLLSLSPLTSARATKTTSQEPEPTPGTIIDYLSSEVQFSYFLRHLQRSGLVPTVNSLQNVTLFAPVNSAFVDDEVLGNDTAGNLLRYFADQKLRIGYLDTRDMVAESLFVVREAVGRNVSFPLKLSADLASKEYYVNDIAQIVEFDFYAKHQHSFVQAIDTLLPLQPSICDMLLDPESDHIDGHSMSFVKKLFQSVFLHPKVKGPSCSEFLGNTSTALLPSDDLVAQSLSDSEIQYYTALYRTLENPAFVTTKDAIRELSDDIFSVISAWLLPELVDGVNGTQPANKAVKVLGKKHKNKPKPKIPLPRYNITLDPATNQLIVNGKMRSSLNSTGLTTRDGLVHIFDTASNEPDASFFSALDFSVPKLIPRKVLFSLHYSQFVNELGFRKLGKLINGKTTNQTLLLDATDRDDQQDEDDVSTSAFSNKQNLLYKFMEGRLDSRKRMGSKRSYQQLLTSKLCSNKRIGSCFKIKVTGYINEDQLVTTFNNDIDSFGDPYLASGNFAIYIGDAPLNPPSSLKHTLADLLSDGAVNGKLEHIKIDKEFCMWTLEHLSAHKLNSVDENYKGYSLILPCGHTLWGTSPGVQSDIDEVSIKNLGLIFRYLEAHPEKMKDILKGLFIEDLIYSDFGLDDDVETSRISRTLRGDIVNISENYRMGDFNHLIKLNNTILSVPLNSDVLFSQGVIHITNKLLLPDDFEVSLLDLLETTESKKEKFSFVSFIKQIPRIREALDLHKNGAGSNYSILVPQPESLESMNITKDLARLPEFLELHLIPNESAMELQRCINQPFKTNQTFTVRTNRTDGVFECQKNFENGKTYLRLRQEETSPELSFFGYNKDKEVKIVTHGCTSSQATSSCVFLIDKPINLAWFSDDNNFPHFNIGWFSMALGVLFGVLFLGVLFSLMIVYLGNRPQKPISKQDHLPNGFPRPPGHTFMRVTSDEDESNAGYDNGYESDDDINGNEAESLFSASGLHRKRPRGYGSIREERMSASPNNANNKFMKIPPSAPRTIKQSRSALNREPNF